MARIDWIEARLQNWARWSLVRGGGMLGYAGVNLADSDAGRDGYIGATIPIGDVEASETDAAVRRLYPGGLALTVFAHYVGRGGIADKLKGLGFISEATYHRRIDQAHKQLAEHFLAQQDRQRAERQRIEALQAKQRPRDVELGSFRDESKPLHFRQAGDR